MGDFINLDDPVHKEDIDCEIARLRQSGILGRSQYLAALFDYLEGRSRADTLVREVEIAQDVFGRTDVVADDGVARVYVHRLRRRLADHYAQAEPTNVQIHLPLGGYRLVAFLVPPGQEMLLAQQIMSPAPPRWKIAALALGGVALGIVLTLAISALVFRQSEPERVVRDARNSPVWATMLRDGRPKLLVLGDNYLFAEFGPDKSVDRLIHDFTIHSRDDLNAYLIKNPTMVDKYVDVGLNYMPLAVAVAQSKVAPVLDETGSMRVIAASRLTPEMMLSNDVLFVGLTSTLGPLQDLVANGSRFVRGANADAIRDVRTGRTYVGQSGMASSPQPQRQFGLLSAFPGVGGNRYLVAVGTGDMALVGMSQLLRDRSALAQLDAMARDRGTFEALYEIEGRRSIVSSVRLIASQARDAKKIWSPNKL